MKKVFSILLFLSITLMSNEVTNELNIKDKPSSLVENINNYVCVHNICGLLMQKQTFNDIPQQYLVFSIEECKDLECKKIEILFKKGSNSSLLNYQKEEDEAAIQKIEIYSKQK